MLVNNIHRVLVLSGHWLMVNSFLSHSCGPKYADKIAPLSTVAFVNETSLHSLLVLYINELPLSSTLLFLQGHGAVFLGLSLWQLLVCMT